MIAGNIHTRDMNRGAIPPMIDVIIHSNNLNHGVFPRIGKCYKWNRSVVHVILRD
jgi:hypothetical protein